MVERARTNRVLRRLAIKSSSDPFVQTNWLEGLFKTKSYVRTHFKSAKTNEIVIRILAEHFDLPKSAIDIEKSHEDGKKIVRIDSDLLRDKKTSGDKKGRFS